MNSKCLPDSSRIFLRGMIPGSENLLRRCRYLSENEEHVGTDVQVDDDQDVEPVDVAPNVGSDDHEEADAQAINHDPGEKVVNAIGFGTSHEPAPAKNLVFRLP